MDQAVTARIDHLLRTDSRLAAAAPLIGRIPAIVTEPKSPRARRKKGGKKLPPPRIDESVWDKALRESSEQSRDEDEEEQVRPSAPWLKVVKVKKVPPDLREALGAQALAMAVVDGWLWGQLDAATKDAALILAVRSLVWEEKEDGSDLVRREPPPLQTWPDCVAELSNLVAALTENPSKAWALSDAVESMGAPSDVIYDEGEPVEDVGGYE